MKNLFNFFIVYFLSNVVYADLPYEPLLVTFKNPEQTKEFVDAFIANDLETYFFNKKLSDPELLRKCLVQKHFISELSRNDNIVKFIVADEASRYTDGSRKSFIELLAEWSDLTPVLIDYTQGDHYGNNNAFRFVSGYSFRVDDDELYQGDVKPSFNCEVTKNKTENLICLSKKLSFLDNMLSNQYLLATSSLNKSQQGKIKEEQKAWLKERNLCEDYSCVVAEYNNRISTLVEPYINTKYIVTVATAISSDDEIYVMNVSRETQMFPDWYFENIKKMRFYSLPDQCALFWEDLNSNNYYDTITSSSDVAEASYYGRICMYK